MSLFLIGLGLSTKHVNLLALEKIKLCDKIYLENYTSKLVDFNLKDLENLFRKKIVFASREFLEGSDVILDEAVKSNVALLVIGDVFSATTHTAIFLEAKKRNINVFVVNNASIFTAVGITGLSLYRFGKVTSLVYPQKNYFPTSPYDTIAFNLKNDMHSLVLLDIKKDKLMTINEALNILMQLEKRKQQKIISDDLLVVGCARLGSDDYIIKASSLNRLINFNFGETPHCLIIPAKLHFMEEEVLSLYKF